MTAVKPMLACGLPGDTLSEKLQALDKLPYPLFASAKLDGIRCLITPDGPQTRSGETIPNNFVRHQLGFLPCGLDGELVCLNEQGVVDFRLTTGNIRRASGSPVFQYRVFDHYFIGDFDFRDRLKAVETMILPPWVKILPQWRVDDSAQVRDLFAQELEQGNEGLVLRHPHAKYKHGRSTFKEAGMVKVKPYEDSEAVIVSVFERMHNTNEPAIGLLGQTKRANTKDAKEATGMLGGFVCINPKDVLRYGDTLMHVPSAVTFEVSRGKMTHEEARKLWAQKDSLPGKVIRFQHVTVGGYDAPRHGTFQGFREKWDMDQ